MVEADRLAIVGNRLVEIGCWAKLPALRGSIMGLGDLQVQTLVGTYSFRDIDVANNGRVFLKYEVPYGSDAAIH